MKKYLMTWYGMTDFRASLGLEQTAGPVLGALLAEDYTDVVILGFTHPDKTANEANVFQQNIVNIENSDPATVREFVDLFSNTVEAHNHFNQWLENQLRDIGKKVDVHFRPVELIHLNDTEGIYEAAIQSLNAVAAADGEKFITLYLSPGTPVMAFVWAFVALRYPNLKKRLIASSQPGKPPEKIVLPNEWLEWHGKQIQRKDENFDKYDVIFHLFGEQRMPSLLGVLQFSSKKHIFINSKQFPANVMQQFLEEAEYGEIAVDPYDPENVRSSILSHIDEMPENTRIGFNLTGGTKLMYAGALAACRKVNATPFYFNSRNQSIIFLNDFKSIPTKKIKTVSNFFQLNGDGLIITKPGIVDWNDSVIQKMIEASEAIWNDKNKLARNYKNILPYTSTDQPFTVCDQDFYASLNENHRAELAIGGNKFIFEAFPNFSNFLVGGWFELYIGHQLIPLVEDGVIYDLRVNLEVSILDPKQNENYSYYDEKFADQSVYQEFDIVFTDGYRLFIIECKSGKVSSDHVVKLHEIIKKYGGIEGLGCLVSSYKPSHPIIKQKADDYRNINWLFGAQLPYLLNNFVKNEIKR